MYEKFYGLAERPFDLSPDPRFLFMSPAHREALALLRYGLSGRPGITLLTGEAGTGKTTLIRAAMQRDGVAASSIARLSNPALTRVEFYEYLAARFGFSEEAAHSKPRFLIELERAISSDPSVPFALVVDEAQILPHELLEEIRLLTNTETRDGRTLTIALVGQPELAERLNSPALRQLKQRISMRCELRALTLPETAAYISRRLTKAGASRLDLFSAGALPEIHRRSRGIPRIISVICDNALVTGFAANAPVIGRSLIDEVCSDLDLTSARNELPAAAAVHPPASPETAPEPPAAWPQWLSIFQRLRA